MPKVRLVNRNPHFKRKEIDGVPFDGNEALVDPETAERLVEKYDTLEVQGPPLVEVFADDRSFRGEVDGVPFVGGWAVVSVSEAEKLTAQHEFIRCPELDTGKTSPQKTTEETLREVFARRREECGGDPLLLEHVDQQEREVLLDLAADEAEVYLGKLPDRTPKGMEKPDRAETLKTASSNVLRGFVRKNFRSDDPAADIEKCLWEPARRIMLEAWNAYNQLNSRLPEHLQRPITNRDLTAEEQAELDDKLKGLLEHLNALAPDRPPAKEKPRPELSEMEQRALRLLKQLRQWWTLSFVWHEVCKRLTTVAEHDSGFDLSFDDLEPSESAQRTGDGQAGAPPNAPKPRRSSHADVWPSRKKMLQGFLPFEPNKSPGEAVPKTYRGHGKGVAFWKDVAKRENGTESVDGWDSIRRQVTARAKDSGIDREGGISWVYRLIWKHRLRKSE